MVANANPLPAKHGEFQFPRRRFVDQHAPAERAIYEAMGAVEMLGADPLLTEAVTALGKAADLVADWLEGKTG